MTYGEASEYFKGIHKENLRLRKQEARRRATIQRRWDRRRKLRENPRPLWAVMGSAGLDQKFEGAFSTRQKAVEFIGRGECIDQNLYEPDLFEVVVDERLQRAEGI